MLSDYDDNVEKNGSVKKEEPKKSGLEAFPADAEDVVAVPEQAQPAETPAEETDESRDAKAEAEANTDNPKDGCYRILVVEDARILRKMLVKILSDAGHACDEATQGHEAMAYLRRSKATNCPYDLVITDLMMPEMDGWELIENMTEKKFFPALPMVIITANATLESVKRSSKLGIKNFIVKPFESVRVLETVKKAVARGRPA